MQSHFFQMWLKELGKNSMDAYHILWYLVSKCYEEIDWSQNELTRRIRPYINASDLTMSSVAGGFNFVPYRMDSEDIDQACASLAFLTDR